MHELFYPLELFSVPKICLKTLIKFAMKFLFRGPKGEEDEFQSVD
jgi:hypothetical protein